MAPFLSVPSKDPFSPAFNTAQAAIVPTIDRICTKLHVASLMQGWPVHRDASEWALFRQIFRQDGQAHVWTTWSGKQQIDDFIAVSQKGKEQGASINHRVCGTEVYLPPAADDNVTRAVAVMKAQITQRFDRLGPEAAQDDLLPEDVEVEVDCDCRFVGFFEKEADEGGNRTGPWTAHVVKLIYDKDKVSMVSGGGGKGRGRRPLDLLTDQELARMKTYPEAYRHLAVFQSRLGHEIDRNLCTGAPGVRLERMYRAVEEWLDDKEIDLEWADLVDEPNP